MNNHALIIRFHYEKEDPRFDWRFSYFKTMVLPRILNQTRKDFDICIWCNKWHDEIFKSLSSRIKIFHAKKDTIKYKILKGKKYYYDFIEYEDLEGLDKYEIQSGIDSDDLISRDYIDTIVKYLKNEKDKTHLCFQPKTFNLKTLAIKPMLPYHSKRGSAFLSLYQPNKEDNYKFIYCNSHISMWRYAKKSIVIPSGHCFATIHYLNESTGK